MANGKKILIAEDIQEDLDLIQAQLTGAGYSTVSAVNGIDALKKINAETPDLIITDVLMPDMDGFAFYKELKKSEKTRSIPVVVLSAREKMRDTFLALGAEEFIAKPFKADELISKIDTRMGISGDPALAVSASEEKAEQSPDVKGQEKEEVVQSETSPTAAEDSGTPPSEAQAVILKKVLIAGSSQKILEKIRMGLEQKSCQVVSVETGAEILAKSIEFDPDIVILDVLIPGALSHETIRRIRKQAGFKEKPILTFSYLDKENEKVSVHQQTLDIESGRRLCLEAGAKEFLGGFDEATFISNISQYLNG